MSTIELTEQELTIRKQLIKVASEGKTLYYSDLVKEEDATLVYSLGTILEKITNLSWHLLLYSNPQVYLAKDSLSSATHWL